MARPTSDLVCRNGHPRTAENTGYKGKNKDRYCLICYQAYRKHHYTRSANNSRHQDYAAEEKPEPLLWHYRVVNSRFRISPEMALSAVIRSHFEQHLCKPTIIRTWPGMDVQVDKDIDIKVFDAKRDRCLLSGPFSYAIR